MKTDSISVRRSRILKFLYGLLSRRDLVLGTVFVQVVAAVEMLFPLFSRRLVDTAVGRGGEDVIARIGITLVCFTLVRGISVIVSNYAVTRMRNLFILKARMILFSHVMKIPIDKANSIGPNYLMSRISDDSNTLEAFLSDSLLTALLSATQFVAAFLILLNIYPSLAIVTICIVPLYAGMLSYFRKSIGRRSAMLREMYANVQKTQQELLTGTATIRLLSVEGWAINRVEEILRKFTRERISLNLQSNAATILPFAVSWLADVAILWGGCVAISRGSLSIGSLVAMLTYTDYLFSSISNIYNFNINIEPSFVAAGRILNLLDERTEVETGETVFCLEEGIVFNHIAFAYDGKQVLRDISFRIAQPQIVSLVGSSGAGKTTLISLLTKVHRADKGSILIDSVDLEDISQASIREHMGVCPQDPFLFSGSIGDNIRLGKTRAVDDEVAEAARIACIGLPLTTLVNERGTNLSGGERQRIVIARAVIRKPEILILDEATSEIDAATEESIVQAIRERTNVRITLICSHRLSTMLKADKILVMEAGSVVAEGKHDTLYKSCEVYQNLLKRQIVVR